MARNGKLRSAPLPRSIIDAVPSAFDKRGSFYFFTEHHKRIAKYGRSNCAPRRKKEWARQCRPQKQDWECYWVVPYAAKFGEFLPFGLCGPLTAVSEALIHAHFKRAGAWIRPVPCAYCGVKHCEKFDYRICGGRREVFRVVKYYLGRLGWPVIRYVFCLFNLIDIN
jgi:hypothetical protein